MRVYFIAAIFMIVCIFGCAAKEAKDSAEALQGAGFQSASGNRGQIGDIGDRAGRDLEKSEIKSAPVSIAPASTQTAGIQYGKTVVTDVWAMVGFFLGFVLLREGFSYLRMRIKET